MVTQHEFRLSAVRESDPGQNLKPFFERYWPDYARWMRRAPTMPAAQCLDALNNHMPELMPVFHGLSERFGGGDPVARFLSLYRPPPLVRGCSQAVVHADDGPVLLRNYDYIPRLIDGILLRSDWSGSATLAMTDCVWGALDGINEHGLAVALSFGGSNAVGPGFAAPLIVRYLLQTCGTTAEASRALGRLPVHMAYTFVVLDRSGEHVTAFLGPDQPARLEQTKTSTNHQRSPGEWPEYERQTRTVERLEAIDACIRVDPSMAAMLPAFLRPPVWCTDYKSGSGTLYCAAYSPLQRSLALFWPDRTISTSLDTFAEFETDIFLPGATAGIDRV